LIFFLSISIYIQTHSSINNYEGNPDNDGFDFKINESNQSILGIAGEELNLYSEMAIDSYGNIYTAYYNENSSQISPSKSLIVSKIDKHGIIIWSNNLSVKSFGMKDIEVDYNGNLYVAGIQFVDNEIIESYQQYYDLANDCVIIKYSSIGELKWVQSVGDSLTVDIFEISINQKNDIFVAGSFSSGSITIGETELINRNLTGDTADSYIAKLDDRGNWNWAISFGGKGHEGISSTYVTNNGEILIGGTFDSDLIVINDEFTIKSNNSYSDSFVGKLDHFGNIIHFTTLTGQDDEKILDISADNNGGVAVVGTFRSDILNSDCGTNIRGTGVVDSYVVKYDSNLKCEWVRTFSSDSYTFANQIAIDKNLDSIFIAGFYYGEHLIIGNDIISNPHNEECVPHMSDDCFDIFLVQLSETGDNIGAMSFGGPSTDISEDLLVSENVYLTMYSKSPVIKLNSFDYTINESFDIYLIEFEMDQQETPNYSELAIGKTGAEIKSVAWKLAFSLAILITVWIAILNPIPEHWTAGIGDSLKEVRRYARTEHQTESRLFAPRLGLDESEEE